MKPKEDVKENKEVTQIMKRPKKQIKQVTKSNKETNESENSQAMDCRAKMEEINQGKLSLPLNILLDTTALL